MTKNIEDRESSKIGKWWRWLLKGIAEGVIVEEKLDPNKPTDAELMAFRSSVCRGDGKTPACKWRDTKADMCRVCGCFLDLKIQSKTNRTKRLGIQVTHCPHGYWNDIDIAKHYNNHEIFET